MDVVERPATYRLRGKAFGLTWAHCEFEADEADLELFIREHVKPARYIVCKEHHQDGTPHYHGYIEFENEIEYNISRVEFQGKRPQVKPKSNRKAKEAAFYYCTKDGSFRCSPEWESGYPDPVGGADATPTLREGLDASNTLFEFLEWGLKHGIPHGYVQAAWRCVGNGVEVVDDNDGEIVSPVLRAMAFDMGTTRSLCIVGASGTGKTTWARRNVPKPAIRVTHIDDLKAFRPNFHRGIIFDDMHFAGDENGKGAWPRTSQIHLVDFFSGGSINVKHSVVHLPPKVYKIFLANVYPFVHDPAIERRVCLRNI